MEERMSNRAVAAAAARQALLCNLIVRNPLQRLAGRTVLRKTRAVGMAICRTDLHSEKWNRDEVRWSGGIILASL
jgi:hypothetical protein